VPLEWGIQVTVSLDQEAVAAAVCQLGWRVYVTTQPPAPLSLQEAVLAYRREYLVERALLKFAHAPEEVLALCGLPTELAEAA
jgi:hypothetical protein